MVGYNIIKQYFKTAMKKIKKISHIINWLEGNKYIYYSYKSYIYNRLYFNIILQ